MEKQRISQARCIVGKAEHSRDAPKTRFCLPDQLRKKDLYEASSNASWKNIVKKVRRTNQYYTQKESFGEPAPFFGIQASASPFGFLSKEKRVDAEILSKPGTKDGEKREISDVGRNDFCETNTFTEKFGVDGVWTTCEKNNNGRKIFDVNQTSCETIQVDGSCSDKIKEKHGNICLDDLRSAVGEEEGSQDAEFPKEKEETFRVEEKISVKERDEVGIRTSLEKEAEVGVQDTQVQIPCLTPEVVEPSRSLHRQGGSQDDQLPGPLVQISIDFSDQTEASSCIAESTETEEEKLLDVEAAKVEEKTSVKEEVQDGCINLLERETEVSLNTTQDETFHSIPDVFEYSDSSERQGEFQNDNVLEPVGQISSGDNDQNRPSGCTLESAEAEEETLLDGEVGKGKEEDAKVEEKIPFRGDNAIEGNTSFKRKTEVSVNVTQVQTSPSTPDVRELSENLERQVGPHDDQGSGPMGQLSNDGNDQIEASSCTAESAEGEEEEKVLDGDVGEGEEEDATVGEKIPLKGGNQVEGNTSLEGKIEVSVNVTLVQTSHSTPDVHELSENLERQEEPHPDQDQGSGPMGQLSSYGSDQIEASSCTTESDGGEGKKLEHLEFRKGKEEAAKVEESIPLKGGNQVERKTSLEGELEVSANAAQVQTSHLMPTFGELSEKLERQEGPHADQITSPKGQLSSDGNDQIEAKSCTTKSDGGGEGKEKVLDEDVGEGEGEVTKVEEKIPLKGGNQVERKTFLEVKLEEVSVNAAQVQTSHLTPGFGELSEKLERQEGPHADLITGPKGKLLSDGNDQIEGSSCMTESPKGEEEKFLEGGAVKEEEAEVEKVERKTPVEGTNVSQDKTSQSDSPPSPNVCDLWESSCEQLKLQADQVPRPIGQISSAVDDRIEQIDCRPTTGSPEGGGVEPVDEKAAKREESAAKVEENVLGEGGDQGRRKFSLEGEKEECVKVTQDQRPDLTQDVGELSESLERQVESQADLVPGPIEQIPSDGHDQFEPSSSTTANLANKEHLKSEVTSQIVAVIVEDKFTELPSERQNDVPKDSQTAENTSQRSGKSGKESLYESSEATADRVLEEALLNAPGTITFTTGEELVKKLTSLTTEGNVHMVETGECLEETQQSIESSDSHPHSSIDLGIRCNGIRDDVQDVMVTQGQTSSPKTTFTDLTSLSPIRTSQIGANSSITHTLTSSASCDSSCNLSGSGDIPQNIATSPEKQLSELMRVVDELYALHQDEVTIESADVNTLLGSGDATSDSKNLPLLFKTPPRRANPLEKHREDAMYGENIPLVDELRRDSRNSPFKNMSQLDTLAAVSHSYQTVNLPVENSFGDSDSNFQVSFSSNRDSPDPASILENIDGHEVASELYEGNSLGSEDNSPALLVPDLQSKGKGETLTKMLADIVESSKSKTKVKNLTRKQKGEASQCEGGIILKRSERIKEKAQNRTLQEEEQGINDGEHVSFRSASANDTAALVEIPSQDHVVNTTNETVTSPSTDIPVPGFRIIPQYDNPEPVNESFPMSDYQDIVPAIAMEVEILNGRQEVEEGGVFVPPGSIEDLPADETPKKSRYVRKGRKTPAKVFAKSDNASVEESPKRKRVRSKKVKENLEMEDAGIVKKRAKRLPKRRRVVSEEEEIHKAAEVLTSLSSSDDSQWSRQPLRSGDSGQRIDMALEGEKTVGALGQDKGQVSSDSAVAGLGNKRTGSDLEEEEERGQGTAVIAKDAITPDLEALLSKFESESSAVDQTGESKKKVTSKIRCQLCQKRSRRCTCKNQMKVKRTKYQVRTTASRGVQSNYRPQPGRSCSYQLTFDDGIEENDARSEDILPIRRKENILKSRIHKETHLMESGVRKSFLTREKDTEITCDKSSQCSVKEKFKVTPDKEKLSYCNILSQPSDRNIKKKHADSMSLREYRLSHQLRKENVQKLPEAKSASKGKENEVMKQLSSDKTVENVTEEVIMITDDSDTVSQQPVVENVDNNSCPKYDLKQKNELESVNIENSEGGGNSCQSEDLEQNKLEGVNSVSSEEENSYPNEDLEQKNKLEGVNIESNEAGNCPNEDLEQNNNKLEGVNIESNKVGNSSPNEDLKQKHKLEDVNIESSEGENSSPIEDLKQKNKLEDVNSENSKGGNSCPNEDLEQNNNKLGGVNIESSEGGNSSPNEDLKQKNKWEGVNSESSGKKEGSARSVIFEVVKSNVLSDGETEDEPVTYLQASVEDASELDWLGRSNCKCSVVSQSLRISLNNGLVDEKRAVIVDYINKCSEGNEDQQPSSEKTQREDCKGLGVNDQTEKENSTSLPIDQDMPEFQYGRRKKNLKQTFSPSLMKKYEQIRQISEKSRARRMKKYHQRQNCNRGVPIRKYCMVEIVDDTSEMTSSGIQDGSVGLGKIVEEFRTNERTKILEISSPVTRDDSVGLQEIVKEMKANDKPEPSVHEILSPATLSKFSELIKYPMSPKVVLTDFRKLSGKTSPSSEVEISLIAAEISKESDKDKKSQLKEKYRNILRMSSPLKRQERNTPSQKDISSDMNINHPKQNKIQNEKSAQNSPQNSPKIESVDVCIVSGDEMVTSDQDSEELISDNGCENDLFVRKLAEKKTLKRRKVTGHGGDKNEHRNKDVIDFSAVVYDVSTEEEDSNFVKDDNAGTVEKEGVVQRLENLSQPKGGTIAPSIPVNEMNTTSHVEEKSQDETTGNSDKEVVDKPGGNPKELEGVDNSLHSVPVNQPDFFSGKTKKSKLALKDILPRRKGRQRRGGRKAVTEKELTSGDALNEGKSSVHEGKSDVFSDSGKKEMDKTLETLGENGVKNMSLGDSQEAEVGSALIDGSTNEIPPFNGEFDGVVVREGSRLPMNGDNLKKKLLDKQNLHDENSIVNSKDQKSDSVQSCNSLSKEISLQNDLQSQTKAVCNEEKTDGVKTDLPEETCASKEKQKSPEKDICPKSDLTKSDVSGEHVIEEENLISTRQTRVSQKKGATVNEKVCESGLVKLGKDFLDKNDLNFGNTTVGLSEEISLNLNQNGDVLRNIVETEGVHGEKNIETAHSDVVSESADDPHLKRECGQFGGSSASESSTDFVKKLPLSVKLRPCFVVLKPLDRVELGNDVNLRLELRTHRKRKKKEEEKDESGKRRKLNSVLGGIQVGSVREVKKASEMSYDSASSDACDLKHRKEEERKRREKKGKRRKKQKTGEEKEEKSMKTDNALAKGDIDTDGVRDSLSSTVERDSSSCDDNQELEVTLRAKKEEVEGILKEFGSAKEAYESQEEMDVASGHGEGECNHEDGASGCSDEIFPKNGRGETAHKEEMEDIEASEEQKGDEDGFIDDDCLSITAECTDLLSEFEDEEMETEPVKECEPAEPAVEEASEASDTRLEYETVSSDDNLGLSPNGCRVQKQVASSSKEVKGVTSVDPPPKDLLPVKLMPRIPKKSAAIIAAVTTRNASQSKSNSVDDMVADNEEDGPHPPNVTRKLHPDIPTVSFAGENHPGLPVPSSSNGESVVMEPGKILSTSGSSAPTSKQAAEAGWQLTDKARQKCPPGYCYKFAEFGKCHYGATCRFKHVLLKDIPRPEENNGNSSQPAQQSVIPSLMQGVQQPPPLMQLVINKPATVGESSKSRTLSISPFPEEGPLLPEPVTFGDSSQVGVSSSSDLLESSLPPPFPHQMEDYLTYIETGSKDGELLQNETNDSLRRDNVKSSGDHLNSRRDIPGGTAARRNDGGIPPTSRSSSLSVVHDLLRKKRVSDAWNVYRLKTQQEGFAPDRQLLLQIIQAFPSARFSKLKWKDCKEALKEFGKTFDGDITPHCLQIIQHLCNSQENDPEDDEDYEDPLPIAVGVFKDCVPNQNRVGAENTTLNSLSEKLIQESHWSLLGTFVSLQLNKGFKPSLSSLRDVISKYHVLNNHYEDLVNLMKKIDERNIRLPISLYDGVKNCLAVSSQYTDEGLEILKMKGKFYPLDSIEKSLVEMCSVNPHEIELTEAPAPEINQTAHLPENVSSGRNSFDGETREIATIIQKAKDIDTLIQLFLTIVGSGETHVLDTRIQDCFACTISKMAPSNHCHLYRKFVHSVVSDQRTGVAERKFALGIGKIIFQRSWKNKHAEIAYQVLEVMSEFDGRSIQSLFMAKERQNKNSMIYGELHAVISCYINACDILQAVRVLNSLTDGEWNFDFWKKITNSLKWRETVLDLAKRLAVAGYFAECLQLLRNFTSGMPARGKSTRNRQVTKEVFNLLFTKSFERDENVFALEQVFPAIQELSILDKTNTVLMVRVFASQGTPETTRMAQELFQTGLREGVYLPPVINESIHEGKVQVSSDKDEISLIVQEFFRQSDKFLTGVYTNFKCDEDRTGMFVDHMKFRFLVTVVGTPFESNTISADDIVDETLMKIIQELAKVISQFNCQIETLNAKEKVVNLPPDAIKGRFLHNMQRQVFR